jgi:Fe-S cluster assembly iron-binding protein IscA
MIHITQPAVDKLHALILEHPEDPIVRLGIRDGKDNTLIFSITLEDAILSEDTVLDIEGLTIVMDRSCAQRIEGITVDYEEETGFLFHHPEPPNAFNLNLIQPE